MKFFSDEVFSAVKIGLALGTTVGFIAGFAYGGFLARHLLTTVFKSSD